MLKQSDHKSMAKVAYLAASNRLSLIQKLDFGKWSAAFRTKPVLGAALVFSVLASIYWLVVASDRYVSEAHVIVQRTDLVANVTPDISTLLTGDTSGNRHDQLVLRDYLLSKDMAIKLDQELNLRKEYSSWGIDPFSRLGSDSTNEELYGYYRSRVSVEYDEYAGVLVIRAQAFAPEGARKITSMLVSEGERFMNATAHGLAEGQVAFLEQQVTNLNKRTQASRQAVIDYQNREGIVSPVHQAEAIGQIIAGLESKRAELQVALAAQKAFLVDDYPSVVELEQQIDSISAQIEQENAKLVSPKGGRLNTQMERFMRLEEQAKFDDALYRSALAALEKGRVESTRAIKKLSIIASPNLPQEAELPERWRQAITFTLLAFLVAGVAQLLILIVKDHRD